jgi:hypothetical protein
MSGCWGGGSWPFDQSQTWLVGIPQATLQAWLTQCQTAMFNQSIGANPITLSYTQGDGSKSVTRNITNVSQLQTTIMLLASALGLVRRARRPAIPFFR